MIEITNKEILAELKKSYAYLQDIRENGCNEQLESNQINQLEVAMGNISDIYRDFYNSLDRYLEIPLDKLESDDFFDDLGISKLRISSNVSEDYEAIYDDGNSDVIAFADISYDWTNDQDYLEKEEDYEMEM